MGSDRLLLNRPLPPLPGDSPPITLPRKLGLNAYDCYSGWTSSATSTPLLALAEPRIEAPVIGGAGTGPYDLGDRAGIAFIPERAWSGSRPSFLQYCPRSGSRSRPGSMQIPGDDLSSQRPAATPRVAEPV
jgi:hypothetical protein